MACLGINVKTLVLAVPQIWRMSENIKTGVILGVSGHSRSVTMFPYDRIPMTSYLPFVDPLSILYHFPDSELFAESGKSLKVANFC